MEGFAKRSDRHFVHSFEAFGRTEETMEASVFGVKLRRYAGGLESLRIGDPLVTQGIEVRGRHQCRWKAREIFSEHYEMIAYTQRFFGYAMTGSTIEHALAVLWGGGANGKSTLIEIMLELFGDYG